MTATQKASPAKAARSAKGPSEVAPGLFVGGWGEADAFEGTRFCVLDEPPAEPVRGTHIPIYDERTGGALRANLDRLAREVGAARARGEPVVIFCGHGIRRSPLGAAWVLHRNEKLSLDEAFARIRVVRPKVEPPAQWMENPSSLDER